MLWNVPIRFEMLQRVWPLLGLFIFCQRRPSQLTRAVIRQRSNRIHEYMAAWNRTMGSNYIIYCICIYYVCLFVRPTPPKLSTPTQYGPHAYTAKKLYPFFRPILLYVNELLLVLTCMLKIIAWRVDPHTHTPSSALYRIKHFPFELCTASETMRGREWI